MKVFFMSWRNCELHNTTLIRIYDENQVMSEWFQRRRRLPCIHRVLGNLRRKTLRPMNWKCVATIVYASVLCLSTIGNELML